MPFSAQASDEILWKSGLFAEFLHTRFLKLIKNDSLSQLLLDKCYPIYGQRFSINCIAFFSDTIQDIISKGIEFIPEDVDDEEYITSILTVRSGKPGVILNRPYVVHFSFYPQEYYLIKKTKLIYEYAELCGITLNKEDFDDIKIANVRQLLGYTKSYIRDVLNVSFGLYLSRQKRRFNELILKSRTWL